MTQTAFDRFGERLSGLGLDVQAMRMQSDGSLVVGEEQVEWDAARPDVAWATADLFDDGAPLRPYFGFLMQAESIRWLQSPAAGVDAPIFGDLVRKGMRLTNSHASAVSIAEFIIGSVLDVCQRRGEWRQAQAEQRWEPHDFAEVSGTTWLVVGLGHIGAATASRAAALGAKVIGVRRRPSGTEAVDQMITPDGIARALPSADVIVLSAPATPETDHLVDADFLGRVKDGAVLVNVARGSLVDQEALLSALDDGPLGAAVLDVFATEPLPEGHPLWTHPRVTVSPHGSAGGTGRYRRAAEEFFANLESFITDGILVNEITEADLPG